MIEAETARASGAGTRSLSVVVGPRRFDVVVDEHLLVGEVLALVEPERELLAVTMSGESVPLDETVALAHLEPGTMLLTAPLDVDLPVPRLRRAEPEGLGVDGRAGSRAARVRSSSPGGSSSRRRLGYAMSSAAEESSTLLPVGSATARARRPGASGGRAAAGSRQRLPRTGRRLAGVRALALVVVASLLGGLSVVASFLAPRSSSSLWPSVVAIVLMVVGILLVQRTAAPRLVRLCPPILGVVGGAVATAALSQGPVVVVGACAGAALVALAGRSTADPDRYVPRVWLAFAGGLGGLALLVLVVGLPLTAVAAIGLAAVVLVARVVPDLVVDVDDDVLLDINRLSVTSWSPREARRPRRRGWRIDDAAVGSVVKAASVEQLATLVGLAVVSAWSSAVLLGVLATRSAASTLSVQLLLASAAVALALTARAYRGRGDRILLRLAALAPALALGTFVVAGLGPTWGVVAAAVAVVVGLGLVAVAMALGRGLRSLWASRLADLLELLGVVSVLPVALWAAGVVERAMALLV